MGSYQRTFNVSDDWADKRIVLHFGAVRSAFYVWVNGEKVGYSEDGKLPAEFDITHLVKTGENSVSVEVYRWSDGSYLEDQDMWRMSGITWDVFLHVAPKVQVWDLHADASLENDYSDGLLDVNVTVENTAASASDVTLEAVLYDNGQAIWETQRTATTQSGKKSDIAFTHTLEDVSAWSAEIPYLYELVLTLKQQGRLIWWCASLSDSEMSRLMMVSYWSMGSPS